MTKKLALKRDVLTELNSHELLDVVGAGMTVDGCVSIPATCVTCQSVTMCSVCC